MKGEREGSGRKMWRGKVGKDDVEGGVGTEGRTEGKEGKSRKG